MIASFFQSLDREGVDYLLISGQAAILYGAAMFSEDIDLWVDPAPGNVSGLSRALAQAGARYYKLTPWLSPAAMADGHGFHFVVPGDDPVFLDIMGRPPRTGDFLQARLASREFSTSWGRLPTVGIRDLVALKRTQRLSDYPVVGQLVLRYLEAGGAGDADGLGWALANVFTADDLEGVLKRAPQAADLLAGEPELHAFAVLPQDSDEVRDQAERVLWERMQAARQADRRHWSAIIAKLRDLRAARELAPEGTPVWDA